MSVSSLVIRPGDEVTGPVRLVCDTEGVWVAPILPSRGPNRVLPSFAPLRLPARGIDFDDIPRRRTGGFVIEGYGQITAQWDGGRLTVHRVEGVTTRSSRRAEWRTPPCPPPPGGWPRGTDGPLFDAQGNLHVDEPELMASGAAVAMSLFRPDPDETVLVVAASDIAAVEARLRRRLGGRLCVVPSRHTKAELEAAHEHLRSQMRQWPIYGFGQSVDDGGQPRLTVRAFVVTPEIAEWVASRPEGLIELEPTLQPVR